MNFFKSVFLDEPDSPKSHSPNTHSQSDPDPNHQNPTDGGWSFGGLLNTLSTKSESVLETYRRDLKEFGSGLRKEIEVAQGSLGNVGHAIDELGSSVLKNTAHIISQSKEAILAADHESDSSDNYISSSRDPNLQRYSRFDAQVRAIQCDEITYCEDPEDLDDFGKWKSGFVLEDKREECERLIDENIGMEGIYRRVVPASVDEETFWSRYFYRVHKLKQAEDLRANFVKRAISAEDEDLSWDVDDEEIEEVKNENNVGFVVNSKENENMGGKDSVEIMKDQAINDINEIDREDPDQIASDVNKNMGRVESERTVNVEEENPVGESKGLNISTCGDNVAGEDVALKKSKEDNVSKHNEEIGSEGRSGDGETSKDSDFSVISTQPSMQEEEDLGWDEIEDLSSIDEKKDDKKVNHSGSTSTADLRKRLSSAEEEEDLSWDIEDDDEPIKA